MAGLGDSRGGPDRCGTSAVRPVYLPRLSEPKQSRPGAEQQPMNPRAIPAASRPQRRFLHGATASTFFLSALVTTGPVLAQERSPIVEKASSSRAKGDDGAPVLVYEIADFECSHCARFAIDVFPKIDSAFVKTGKVQWVYVNLPVPTHPTSWLAHEAALCAGAVADRFWQMHDRIYASQEAWMSASDPFAMLDSFARDLEVPIEPFRNCTTTDAVSSLLLQDIMFAMSGRINGTPAFIVNNEQSVMGLKSFEEWKSILEPLIKAKSGK
jgi:protein-disulfide isomerase